MMQQGQGQGQGPYVDEKNHNDHQHQPRYGETSMSGSSSMFHQGSGQPSPDRSRGDDSTDEPGKKRQRIQQACKSCGIKRVKCDGQLPCMTCVRTGEDCEYGQPKKRGPPKGSTRGPNKNAASKVKQEEATQQQRIPAATATAAADASASTSSVASPSAKSPRSRTTTAASSIHSLPLPPPIVPLGPQPSHYSQLPHPYPSPAQSLHDPRVMSAQQQQQQQDPRSMPSTPFAGSYPYPSQYAPPPPLQQQTAFSNGYPPPSPPAPPPRLQPPLSSTPLLQPHIPPPPSAARHMPTLPRGTTPLVDPQRGSFMPLPDLSGAPSRPRFRGGTSGIFDYPRQRSGGILDSPSAIETGSTSPLSFALNTRGGGSGGGEGNNRGLMSRTASNARILSRRASEIIADAALEGTSESSRILRYPEIPDSVEATIWSIWWQIISCHWPLLLRESLPEVNGQPRVDKQRHPLLYNAVMALATKIWDSERDGQLPLISDANGPLSVEKLTDLYALRTRYWLLRADNESSVEAAQAMVIMSLRENGDGRSSSSAQYAMSACRVALDIGLHRDLRSRGLSNDEWQARLRLWWCIYILDKTNAAMLGRPCVLRFAESDAPFFEADGPEEYVLWTSASSSPAASSLRGQPSRCLSHLLAGSRLATVCEDVFSQYNVVRPGYDRGQQASWEMTVGHLHRRLQEWHECLPDHLRVVGDRPVFQHVLLQHMWFHAIRVLAYRPHMLKHPSPDSGLPCPHGACTESAHEIGRLVSLYKYQHGFKKLSSTVVYCVFTAATILLGNTTSKDAAAAQAAKSRLRELIEHLGAMSGTWKSARLQLAILRQLGECLEADVTGTGLERPETAASASTGAGAGGGMAPQTEMANSVGGGGASLPGVGVSAIDFAGVGGGSGRIDGFGPSSTPGVPNFLATSSVNGAETGFNNGEDLFGDLGTLADLSSVDIINDVSAARSTLPEQQISEINDTNYWGAMPISAQSGEVWAAFTNQYLGQLNSAMAAAAAASSSSSGNDGRSSQLR